MVGSSLGRILQMSISQNNSILLNLDKSSSVEKYGGAMSLAADRDSGTLMVGTTQGTVCLLQLSD
jgi:hypothetical protein